MSWSCEGLAAPQTWLVALPWVGHHHKSPDINNSMIGVWALCLILLTYLFKLSFATVQLFLWCSTYRINWNDPQCGFNISVKLKKVSSSVVSGKQCREKCITKVPSYKMYYLKYFPLVVFWNTFSFIFEDRLIKYSILLSLLHTMLCSVIVLECYDIP